MNSKVLYRNGILLYFFQEIVCCFTFFQIQLRTMVGKTIWAVILCFPSWKMGGRKQGYPSRPRRGRDGVYPCLRPPIFQREKTKLCEFGFFQPFFATWLVKMWNIILFLTFSTFCTYQYFMSKFPLYCTHYRWMFHQPFKKIFNSVKWRVSSFFF